MDNLNAHFVGGKLRQSVHQGFLRPLNVGLDDQRQRLYFPVIFAGEEVFKFCGLLTRKLHVTVLALTEERDFAGLAFVRNHNEFVACGRDVGETLNFHGNRGTGALHLLAEFVHHGAHAAEGLARQNNVALL